MNKDIEELLNNIKFEYNNKEKWITDMALSADAWGLLLSYIEQLENNRDKAIDYTDITIELIEQQPTEDDTWILDRLKGFKIILKGDSDE